jgi:hypothetical protein
MKAIIINTLFVALIYIGATSGWNTALMTALIGTGIVLIVANTIAHLLISVFWALTAFRGGVVDDGQDIYRRKWAAALSETHDDELAEIIGQKARMDYFNAVAKVGLSTFKMIAVYFPRTVFLTHIILSAGLFATVYFLWDASYAKVLAAIILFAEIVTYNCAAWLIKHRDKIRDQLNLLSKELETE